MTTTLNASTAGAGGFIATSDNSGSLALQTAGTTAVTIDTSQNVGIGTASPGDKLVVSATSAGSVITLARLLNAGTTTGTASRLLFTNNTDGAGGAVSAAISHIAENTSGAGSLAFYTPTTGSPVERMRIDSSGNVGIGTTSPSTKLQATIASATAYTTSSRANVITIENTTTGGFAGIEFLTQPSSGNAGLAEINSFAPSSGDAILAFSTRGGSTLAERMRIDNSGNLLVGCTSRYSTIVQGLQLQASGSASLALSRTTDNGTVARFFSTSTDVGNISVTGSTTTFNSTSDYRLKENVQPMTGALAKVAQLKPVTYKWKVDGSDGQGFIAHELAEVVPDCVTGEKDALDKDGNPSYQGIDTSFLVATLTAAIQELSAKNDALTARIVALEAK